MTIRKPFYGILMPTLKIDLTSHLESTRSSLPLKRLTLSAAQQLLTNASLLEVFEATVKRMYITALGTKLATARSHWLFGSKIHSFVSCQNQQFPKKMGWCPNFETHPSGCYKLPLFPKVFLVLLLYDWSAGLGLYQYDPCQISKAPATMDINKIPLNRWTWWNMSIACMYTYIYIYTHQLSYHALNLYSISIYFFDFWEPKAFIYTFTQQTPLDFPYESTIRCFFVAPKLRDHHGSQIDQEGTSKGCQSCHLTPNGGHSTVTSLKTPQKGHLLEEPRSICLFSFN